MAGYGNYGDTELGFEQVEGYADAIANSFQIGAAQQAQSQLANLAAGVSLASLTRVHNAILSRISPLVAQASANAGAWQYGEDLLAPNQVAFLDSGDVLVAAGASTGTFTITPSTEYCVTGVYVSRAMTENFSLTTFSVANFSILSLGFSTTGNGTNPGLTLACWDPGQIDRRPLPFLGRRFAVNTQIQVVAHNIKAADSRFMMAIGLRLNVGCGYGDIIVSPEHVPGYSGRPQIPRPNMGRPMLPGAPTGNYGPVPIPR